MSEITLSDLQGGSPIEVAAPVQEPVQEAVQQPINTTEYQPLDIAQIRPFVPKVDQQEAAMVELMGDLDNAFNRTKIQLTEEVINVGKEQIIERQLDEEPGQIPESKVDEEIDTDDEVPEPKAALGSVPSSNPFAAIGDVDLDDLDDDDDEDVVAPEDEEFVKAQKKLNEAKIAAFKEEIKECVKPVKDKVDFSRFTISKKPIAVSKLLTLGDTSKHISDWMLYSSKTAISMSELSGPEIEKFNPSNTDRNRTNTYKNIYSIMYNHLVDDNKPATLEAWVKSILFFDIKHLYFTVYKACFEGGNFLPYTCPHCKKIFMQKTDVKNMVKYKTPEIEAAVKALVQKDTTSAGVYETQLVAISDKYAVALRVPTVHNVIFENSILSEEFTQTYSDILGIMAYIDEIYYINNETMELTPIDTKPDPTNLGKTVRRKIKIYHNIFKDLSSDRYNSLLMEIKDVNKYANDDITYIIPSTKCTNPECGKEIPEEAKDPVDMLFTRHQLVVLANM